MGKSGLNIQNCMRLICGCTSMYILGSWVHASEILGENILFYICMLASPLVGKYT